VGSGGAERRRDGCAFDSWDFVALVQYVDNEAAFRALAKIGKLEVVKTETFPIEKVDLFFKTLAWSREGPSVSGPPRSRLRCAARQYRAKRLCPTPGSVAGMTFDRPLRLTGYGTREDRSGAVAE
jgi:hypothetical protein